KTKRPESVESFLVEVDRAAGADTRLDEAAARLRKVLADTEQAQYRARRVVESMAMVLQGSLLVRHSPHAVADAFCASRLGGDWGAAVGTLAAGIDTAEIGHRPTVTG